MIAWLRALFEAYGLKEAYPWIPDDMIEEFRRERAKVPVFRFDPVWNARDRWILSVLITLTAFFSVVAAVEIGGRL